MSRMKLETRALWQCVFGVQGQNRSCFCLWEVETD